MTLQFIEIVIQIQNFSIIYLKSKDMILTYLNTNQAPNKISNGCRKNKDVYNSQIECFHTMHVPSKTKIVISGTPL